MSTVTTDPKRDTITVDGIVYDVEESTDGRTGSMDFTIERDGEEVFEGLKGEIYYDEFAQDHANPRDWSNVGTMFVDYPRYILGDEHGADPRCESTCEVCEGSGYGEGFVVWLHTTTGRKAVARFDNEDDADHYAEVRNAKPVDGSIFRADDQECSHCDGYGEYTLHPYEFYKREHGARVVMPLFVYEHSGITIRAGAPFGSTDRRGRFMGDDAGWDTSFVGFVYDTPEGRRQCIGDDATDDQIEKALDSEVEIYASYLEGDVTGYNVEDDESDYYDGCGGFVGGHGDEARVEMFESLGNAIIKRLAEIKEREHMAARDIVTA